MPTLLWTFGFLMLLSLGAYARFEAFWEEKNVFDMYLSTKALDRKAGLMVRDIACELVSSPQEKSDQPKKPRIRLPSEKPLYLDLPFHNTRLNLLALFKKQTEETHYHLAARLLHCLYPVEPIETFYRILDQIVKRNPLDFTKATDLATMVLNDPKDQEVLYHVLKHTPVFECLTFEARRHKFSINIHLARRELLLALFDDVQITNEIMAQREALYAIGERKTSTKESRVTNAFLSREDVEHIVVKHHKNFSNYAPLLDFTVGRPKQAALPHDFSIICRDEKANLSTKKQIFDDNTLTR